MERFTNDRNKYINEIESELINFIDENDFQTVFNYVEIPFFLNYAFSYNWSVNLKNNTFRLIFREWNAEYDNKRFNKGIYNLDRLAINEKQINLSEKEIQFIDSIEINTFQTNKFEGIILDGLMCSLIIPNKETRLRWNIDNEINYELFKLVNTLRVLWQSQNTEGSNPIKF